MLLVLHRGGFLTLDPEPPPPPSATGELSADAADYRAHRATPQDKLRCLLAFRTVNPVYGTFLVEQLAVADENEKVQALESVLEVPRNMLRLMRVPDKDELPAGPLETGRLDPELLTRGLIAPVAPPSEEDDEEDDGPWEERPPAFADKLRLWFDVQYPGVDDVHAIAVWSAGELLRFGGDFHKYIRTRDLAKQEGVVFRHLLRMILLCEEIARVPPADVWPEDWSRGFLDVARRLTESCRAVDPTSTDEIVEQAHAEDESPKLPT
jgi:hypothetical protein